MSSLWLRELQSVFGDSRVENALEGTNLVDLGRDLNFGCYVVRNAIDFGTAEAMMVQSKKDMQRIMESDVRQHRAVTTFYNSVQACHGYCRCKCLYEGTTRHQVYGLEQVPSLNQFHQWLHTRVAVPSAHMFNEAILNVYSHELDEHIPWHTDQNALYSDEMDVVAMNLGAPGIYCYGPWREGSTIWQELSGKGKTWRKQAIDFGVRGMLPVLPGDLTLTTGTWHCYFLHKTLQPSRIWSDQRADLLAYYPATSAASVSLLDRFELPRDPKVFGRDRACMTFRRIENHCNQCIYA